MGDITLAWSPGFNNYPAFRAWSGCRKLLSQFPTIVCTVDAPQKVLCCNKQGDLRMSSKPKGKSSLNGACFFFWKGELLYTHQYKMPSITIQYYWWFGNTVLHYYCIISCASSELTHWCVWIFLLQTGFCVYSLGVCRNWNIMLQFSVCICNTVSLKSLAYSYICKL